MDDRWVFCPLMDRKIEDIDCIENRDVVDGMIIESSMPNEYKKKERKSQTLRFPTTTGIPRRS